MKRVLVVILLLLGVTAGFAGSIELLGVDVYRQSYGATVSSTLTALVKVQNLGYHKTIRFHALLETGSWADLDDSVGYRMENTYLYTLPDGSELWRVKASKHFYSTKTFYKDRFALKYEVNSNTYWDNNAGRDYVTGYSGYLLSELRQVLLTDSNIFRVSYNGYVYYRFYGTVRTQKTETAKKVNIVYSTDGWRTVKTASAVLYGIGHYGFSIDLPIDTTEVRYAVSLDTEGQTFWDNNFGTDYSLKP